jgi:hypothetical protein
VNGWNALLARKAGLMPLPVSVTVSVIVLCEPVILATSVVWRDTVM